MALKYVRKTGSDSNGGTGPSDAYLTIGKALTVLAAGDTCYIGAGVYRESGLNFTNSGSAGNIITLKGDIDGSQTGDAGIVRVTASADDNAFTNANVFNLGVSKAYYTIDSLWMDFASAEIFKATSTTNSNITIQNCWITNGKSYGINISGPNCTVNNCRIWNMLSASYPIWIQNGVTTVTNNFIENYLGSSTNNYGILVYLQTGNLTATINNNYISGGISTSGTQYGISVFGNSLASTTVNIYNNTITRLIATASNVEHAGIYLFSFNGTSNIYNNYIQVNNPENIGNQYAIKITGTGFTSNGNYNAWTNCPTGVTGYSAGAQDKANNSFNVTVPPLPLGTTGYSLGFYQDKNSGCYDAGTTNSGAAPTSDMMGNPRPGSYGQDIGAIERQGSLVKDTSTFNTASPATRIDGAGYVDFKFAVNSGKTYTIAAYLKTNASYSGTQPSLTVQSNSVGMSGTITYTGVANAWQQNTIPTGSMVASGDGVITVRFQTYSTAASSQAWIDDITVSEA